MSKKCASKDRIARIVGVLFLIVLVTNFQGRLKETYEGNGIERRCDKQNEKRRKKNDK